MASNVPVDLDLLGVFEAVDHRPRVTVWLRRRNTSSEHRRAVDLEHASLADHLVEHGHRRQFVLDEVTKNVAGPNRWQLVVVTDQDESSPRGVDTLEQRRHERHVHHRHLVNDDEITVDLVHAE